MKLKLATKSFQELRNSQNNLSKLIGNDYIWRLKIQIMKRNLITAVFCLLTGVSMAQFDKGTVLLGGHFSFSSQKIESTPSDIKMNSFHFEPDLNFYLNPNMAVGLMLGFTSVTSDIGDLSEDSTLFTFAPTFKYSKSFKDKASFYGLAGIAFGSGKSVNKKTANGVDVSTTTKLSNVQVFIRPGFNYQLSEHLFLDMNYGLISYNSTTVTPPGEGAKDYKVNNFDIALNMRNLNLGIAFKF